MTGPDIFVLLFGVTCSPIVVWMLIDFVRLIRGQDRIDLVQFIRRKFFNAAVVER